MAAFKSVAASPARGAAIARLVALPRARWLLWFLSGVGGTARVGGHDDIVKFQALAAASAIRAVSADRRKRHHGSVPASGAGNLHFWWWHISISYSLPRRTQRPQQFTGCRKRKTSAPALLRAV